MVLVVSVVAVVVVVVVVMALSAIQNVPICKTNLAMNFCKLKVANSFLKTETESCPQTFCV